MSILIPHLLCFSLFSFFTFLLASFQAVLPFSLNRQPSILTSFCVSFICFSASSPSVFSVALSSPSAPSVMCNWSLLYHPVMIESKVHSPTLQLCFPLSGTLPDMEQRVLTSSTHTHTQCDAAIHNVILARVIPIYLTTVFSPVSQSNVRSPFSLMYVYRKKTVKVPSLASIKGNLVAL